MPLRGPECLFLKQLMLGYREKSTQTATIVQRVQLSISSDEKQTIDEFVSIRDKILAMISFAIKNNVNMEEIETLMEEVETRRYNIRQKKISGDNVYQFLCDSYN